MSNKNQFILFFVEGQSFVIPLKSVIRIVRAVSITPLPKMPDVVEGVLNLQGDVIPVVNLRKRFNLPARLIEPEDHFIVVNTEKRIVAILVDEVSDIIESDDDQVVKNKAIIPGSEHIEGIVMTDQGMILIQDLDQLLLLEEEEQLDASLKKSHSVMVS